MSTNSNLYKKLLGVGLGSALAISGAFIVAPFEGKENKAYIDPVGIVTVCYGNTGKEAVLGKTYTDDQCLDQMATDLKEHDKQLISVVKVPFKSDYQHAAMLSFVYNAGIGNFSSSTMLKKLNAKDYDGACQELTKWVYAKKQKLKGLVIRRSLEYKYCMGEVPVEAINEVNRSNNHNRP
jgi:lysozyme